MNTYFVTLNWNTTDYVQKLIETVEDNTPEPHTWIVLDNGSIPEQRAELLNLVQTVFAGHYCIATERREGWGTPKDVECIVVFAEKNLGCVLGHNLAFDMIDAARYGDGPTEIVMLDADVEVYQNGWLTEVRQWAERDSPQVKIGIVGLEHSAPDVCAGAVFLDTSGNWYLHRDQTARAEPVRAESVGLGMALLRWPVVQNGLHFDTGFELYYKQDDDLCFQVRANLGLDVWAYPIDMVHWGSRGLKENEYNVNDNVRGRNAFDEIKRKNQKYFAQKWAWALRGRRPTLLDEAKHLDEMAALMRERRLDSGLYE